MIRSIGDFIQAWPIELENNCDPQFLKWVISNLATLDLAKEGKAEIIGYNGRLISKALEMTEQGGLQ